MTPAKQLPGPWSLHMDRGAGDDPFNHEWRLLRTGPHSLLFRSPAPDPWIIKLIKPRSTPRDQLRKYINAQARREYTGSHYLRKLGLTTPATHGWGIALSPCSRFESVLFMEPLPDFISGLSLIRIERQPTKRRQFLERLAADVATIYGNSYIHKDCHFDNVCWLGDGRLAWIDNDIRPTRSGSALAHELRKSLDLLYKTAGAHIENEEWRFFMQKMNNRLENHPDGARLSHEIQ